MESRQVTFYVICGAILGFILIHLFLSWVDPLLGSSACPDNCYLTGWPWGSYEHKAGLIYLNGGGGTVTSVSAIGWLLNSLVGIVFGGGLGLLVGNDLARRGQLISLPATTPRKDCLNHSPSSQPEEEGDQENRSE